ncbi:uncharacterized protein LOC110811105 [Carica papaya]|uniref:uncharacterized protein LOC110811105 n=1 Tax=Carica papaya TaxID=3649 RepID=UPI000B8CAEE4|nr:uncharacterized protein LOC110811105 [Carica papaya]
MGESVDLHDDPEELAEEALSLRDLPLHANDDDSQNKPNVNTGRSSAVTEPEFFEFLSNLNSDHDMCPAEEIIFCGKLVPFKDQNAPSSQHTDQNILPATEYYKKGNTGLRRRSESLSELQSSYMTRSSSIRTKLMRNSRSLDYRKLHRFSSRNMYSPESDIELNFSGKSAGKSYDTSAKKTVKPRWYFFMFGMAKFPPEMELRDIKNRQFRRNPSAMFPPIESGGNFPVNRSTNKGSWKFLKALSCKDHASVTAMASFIMPRA